MNQRFLYEPMWESAFLNLHLIPCKLARLCRIGDVIITERGHPRGERLECYNLLIEAKDCGCVWPWRRNRARVCACARLYIHIYMTVCGVNTTVWRLKSQYRPAVSGGVCEAVRTFTANSQSWISPVLTQRHGHMCSRMNTWPWAAQALCVTCPISQSPWVDWVETVVFGVTMTGHGSLLWRLR